MKTMAASFLEGQRYADFVAASDAVSRPRRRQLRDRRAPTDPNAIADVASVDGGALSGGGIAGYVSVDRTWRRGPCRRWLSDDAQARRSELGPEE